MFRNEFRKALTCSLLIFMLLITSVVMLLGEAIAASLAQEEIVTKIDEHVMEIFGYSRDEYDFATLEFQDGIWGFAIVLKEHPDTQDGLIVGSMDKEGMLISIEGPSEISLEKQVQISLKNSFQSIERMYEFKQEWEQKFQALTEAGRVAEIEEIRNSHYLQMVYVDIGLPGEGDITREVALNRAREEISELANWSKEKIDFFNLDIEIYYTPRDIGKPVYQFLFQRRLMVEDQYAGDAGERAYMEYLEELFSAFGGGNGTTPWYISIMIDAKTGELVEEPKIECPPVESHFLDFFLR